MVHQVVIQVVNLSISFICIGSLRYEYLSRMLSLNLEDTYVKFNFGSLYEKI